MFFPDLFGPLTRIDHMGKFNETGYSAAVDMWLECAGHTIPLAQTSDTFVIAIDPIDLPPYSPARVVLTVDDKIYPRDVTLVDGMMRDRQETAVQEQNPAPF
jgi:hypothetical protein